MANRTEPTSLKSDGRYKDAPRYQVIYGYEDEFKQSFSPIMTQMIKEIIRSAKTMIDGGSK